MPGGRPSPYSLETLVQTKKYIDSCKDTKRKNLTVRLPTIEGLAYYLKVHKDTVYTWRREHPEFSDLIEELLAKQVDALINNGLAGTYNPTIAKVLLAKHGYAERQELVHELPKGFLNIDPLNDQADPGPSENSGA